MDNNQQSLRLNDYTVLATLGLVTLYGNVAAQLDTGCSSTTDELDDHRIADMVYTSPRTPRGRRGLQNRQVADCTRSTSRKRKGAFDDSPAANGIASVATPLRLQSPKSSDNYSEEYATRSVGRQRHVQNGTNGYTAAATTRLKSAFARVRLDSNIHAESDLGAEAGGAEARARRGRAAHATRGGAIADDVAGATDMRPKEYGEVWFDRYLILARLGEGAFSQAFLAADLHCNRMGRKHDATRLVTVKRMGAREGAIGISDYQTISLLNRLDPKERIPIVRVYNIFLQRQNAQRKVEYDPASRQLIPVHQPQLAFSRHRKERVDAQHYSRHGRRQTERAQLRVFGSAESGSTSGLLSETDALASSTLHIPPSDGGDYHVCIVMEPLLGGTLHDAFPRRINSLYATSDELIAKQLHMDMIRTVIRQLLISLAHIHGSSLIHADIKTTNVICVDDKSLRVKLIDFGNAVSDGDVVEYYSTFEIQTVWFRAPEVAYQRPFGRAIDMWSIGCVMCELWLGRSLFTDMDNHNLIHSILKLRGPPPAQLYSASPAYAEVARSWSGRPTPGFAPAVVGNRHKGVLHPELSMDWDPQLRMQWLKHSLHVQDDDFVSLADALLEYDPEERLTATEALDHPFFRGMYTL
ncbi:hypothetical protein H4R24_003124 [Coemansia sp. RSA 988]|nr:hypothetical protein H4R24_003124 [Coemansia sp. RSA 988]